MALAAAAVLTAAIAAERWGRAPAPGERDLAAAKLLFPLAAPHAPGLTPPAADSGLFGRAESDDTLSFDEFMGYLHDVAQDPAASPAAKQFVGAFNERPELKAIHQKFKDASVSGKESAASAFVEALRAEPAFRQLTAKFLGSPQSTAFLASGKFPELADVAAAFQESRGAAPPARIDAPAKTPPWRPPTFEEARKSVLGSIGGQSSVAGRPLASAGPAFGSGAHAGAERGHGPAAAEPGGAPAVPEGRVAGVGSGGGDGSKKPGAGVPNTIKDVKQITLNEKLAKLLQLHPYLAKYFEPAELEKLAEDIDRYGLWGACFANGWLDRCVSACREGVSRGKATCKVPSDLFAACSEAFGEQRCVGMCKEQPPCFVPARVMARMCDPNNPARPPECSQTPSPTPTAAPGRSDPPKCILANGCYKDLQFGGTCCFGQNCTTIKAIGVWPHGTQPCSGMVEPLGICRTNASGEHCCWEESSGSILHEGIEGRSCKAPGEKGACGFPFCCEKAAGRESCCYGKDGALHKDSPPLCLQPSPESPPPAQAPGPFQDVGTTP